jgi:hypothetical protein
LRTNGDLETPLLTRPGGYLLKLEPGQLDVSEFESLLARGHERLAQGDAAGAVDVLDQALALWHGEPLADLAFERFARAEIEASRGTAADRARDRIDANSHSADMHALSPRSKRWWRASRSGKAAGQLMLALYRCGRQADALALYQQTRGLLSSSGSSLAKRSSSSSRRFFAKTRSSNSPRPLLSRIRLRRWSSASR